MIFENRLCPGERRGQTILRTARSQKRKNLIHSSTQRGFTAEPGNPRHCPIPRGNPAVAIEREETVDAGVEQAL